MCIFIINANTKIPLNNPITSITSTTWYCESQIKLNYEYKGKVGRMKKQTMAQFWNFSSIKYHAFFHFTILSFNLYSSRTRIHVKDV